MTANEWTLNEMYYNNNATHVCVQCAYDHLSSIRMIQHSFMVWIFWLSFWRMFDFPFDVGVAADGIANFWVFPMKKTGHSSFNRLIPKQSMPIIVIMFGSNAKLMNFVASNNTHLQIILFMEHFVMAYFKV